MRSQRRAGQSVRLVHVTTTKDRLGNKTTAPTEVEITGAQFEPARPLERTGEAQAPVLQPATWNLPGTHEVDADDLIVHDDTTWYVIGGGDIWNDRTKVPVQRTRTV